MADNNGYKKPARSPILNFEQRIVAVNRGYFYPAGTILFDVTDVAQDFTFIARLSNPRGKTIVQRRQAGHKGLDIAAGVEGRRQRRLDDKMSASSSSRPVSSRARISSLRATSTPDKSSRGSGSVYPISRAIAVAAEKLTPSSSLPKINDREPDRIPENGAAHRRR